MAGNAPYIPGCRDLSLIGERVARSLFSATSDRVGRPVTVTVFPPLSEGRTSEGFDRAAAVAQRLGAHPSVLTIHEWGHADDGRPWIVTDPQPAESVDTLLTMDGPLEVERALQVGVLLAGALETAHRAGIVHGDLSPARLVFGTHGEPLLVETGLAAFAVFPGLGALNNPVRYHAPPEVLERTDVGPTTDVYSLATTVYALLAGRAPQQKPAEITDSNASLLLRILQMSVPAIDRPDLPPGLEDVLRGPLSANPDKRPQRAIDVAWLLQDVQRRAGFAVSEPVVLDLDDLGAAAGVPARPRAAVAPTMGSAAAATEAPVPFGATSAPAPPAGDAPPPPDPWATTVEPPANPWAPAAEPPAAAFSPPAPPVDPPPEVVPEADVPPPTIFPFAEGLGAPRAGGPGTVDDVPAGPLWPSTSPAEPPPDALWPSSWPADQSPSELPAWAAPPTNGDAPAPAADAETVAAGDDGGSIDDVGDLAPAAGGAAPLAPFGYEPPQRPPELDELPSWYTDPLPNADDRARGNGHTGAPSAPAAGASWPPAGGNGRSNGDAHPTDASWPVERPPAQGDERLPGAGDELRSLFGEVVGDPDGPADRGLRAPDATRPRPALPAGPDPDPLGPPRDRPPIDLSQLDTPLGPSPYLPPNGASGTTDEERPARLPRRHEVPSWQPPDGDDSLGAAPRLPRATEARAGRTTRELGTGEPGPRLERSAPRQVAPERGREAGPGAAAMAGPPALPVMVLIGVVAVLILGVAWLVITGDEAEPPASERPTPEATDADAGGDAGAAAVVPTGVQANAVPEGIQVTWTGADDTSYVVTVLSPDQPPKELPATRGTSLLVPNVELGSGGGRCFTVAAAPGAEGAAGTPSEPGCTPGAAIEGMQAAAPAAPATPAGSGG